MTPRERSAYFWEDIKRALMTASTILFAIVVIRSCILPTTFFKFAGRLIIPSLIMLIALYIEEHPVDY